MPNDLNNNKNRKREELLEFYYKIKDCRECGLHKTRTNFVFGSGNSNAPVVFVGEAPGKNEDLKGKPFVGPAGRILDELLAIIGFKRDDIFIANVLKCRPPENRDPNTSEINTCKKYLFRQLEIIDPKIICTLGKYSTQLILDTTTGIGKLRGKVFRNNDKLIIPINHPAAALYTPKRLQFLKEDFKKIRDILKNYQEPESVVHVTDLAGQFGSEKVRQNEQTGKTIDPGSENIDTADKKQLGLF